MSVSGCAQGSHRPYSARRRVDKDAGTIGVQVLTGGNLSTIQFSEFVAATEGLLNAKYGELRRKE